MRVLSKYHSKEEIINFIFWTIIPKNTRASFNFYIDKLSEKLFREKEISYLKNENILFKKCLLEIENYKSTGEEFLIANHRINPSRIKITSTYINFDRVPEWNQKFEDEEIYFSLHRWNWLLTLISDNITKPSFEWGIMIVRSWISEMGTIPKSNASETYSVGERIVNLLIYSRITRKKWSNLPQDITQFILDSSKHLILNLEYYGENFTGNHLFNNARALYIVSKFYNLKSLEKFSKKILKERLKTLITNDGFLREGSSHYHFLFTRWVFELYLISDEFNDKIFNSFLEKELENLIYKCKFFLVEKANQTKIPFFGDISPDSDPEWLIDIPILWEGLKKNDLKKSKLKGWSNIIENNFNISPPKEYKNSKDYIFNKFEDSGWYKLSWNKWNLFWHTKTKNCKSRATHSHQDFGSFVVYYDGQELLKDIGRLNYNSKSKIGLASTLSSSHNSILVDKMPINKFPYDSVFPDKYNNINYTFEINQSQENIKIIFSHDGYSRLVNKKLTHTRTFFIKERVLNIIDDFRGVGKFEIDINFHLNDIPHFNFDILRNKNLEGIISEIKKEKIKDWNFPRYGVKKSSLKINTNFKIKAPSVITHQVQIKS